MSGWYYIDISGLVKCSQLKIGEKTIIRTLAEGPYSPRLIELGIQIGEEIQLLRRAPFNGAFYAKIGSSTFALREEELDQILVD